MGFHAAKLPCRHGPAEGHEGLRKNVDAFRQAREAVGPEFPLKLDCYMALTVPYAIKLARALEPYGLEWIEECLPPDDRSEEHTSELQSQSNLVCRLLLEKKKKKPTTQRLSYTTL